jgi:hypothetical protein
MCDCVLEKIGKGVFTEEEELRLCDRELALHFGPLGESGEKEQYAFKMNIGNGVEVEINTQDIEDGRYGSGYFGRFPG